MTVQTNALCMKVTKHTRLFFYSIIGVIHRVRTTHGGNHGALFRAILRFAEHLRGGTTENPFGDHTNNLAKKKNVFVS